MHRTNASRVEERHMALRLFRSNRTVRKEGTRPSNRRTRCKAAEVSAEPKSYKEKTWSPIVYENGQKAHSLTQERFEVVQDLDEFAKTELMGILKPVEQCWQPADFLPEPSSDDFQDQVRELRERTAGLPDDYLVTFVGDMITEEALPTYMTMLNSLDGIRDETGASQTAWAQWTRQWTAEENRHGDIMNKYMYLTGRVDMKAVESTIQRLIGSGMDPKTENNPYLGFVYTSFQERATKVSHTNTAVDAKKFGDETLSAICRGIAADEARHEVGYSKIVEQLFARDPDGTMLAFADMMRKQIVMPAHMMDDGEHEKKTGRNLFSDFSTVAESTGTYTAMDYADIMEYLIKRWNVSAMKGLKADAEEAQQYLCKLPDRIRKLAERSEARKSKQKKKPVPFSWIYGRELTI